MKWIDVKLKLPKEGQHVLCVQDPTKTATREALFAIFDGKSFIPPKTYEYNKTDQNGKWSLIIYWMPLPKIPKKNKWYENSK